MRAGDQRRRQEGPSGPNALCPNDASCVSPRTPPPPPWPHFRAASGRRASGRRGGGVGGAGSPHSPASASANHRAAPGSLCRGAGPQGYSRALASAARPRSEPPDLASCASRRGMHGAGRGSLREEAAGTCIPDRSSGESRPFKASAGCGPGWDPGERLLS